MRQTGRKIAALGIAVGLVFLGLTGGRRGAKEIEIFYFYENVCDSCPAEADFLELFHDRLDGVPEGTAYTLQLVNVFRYEGIFREKCDQLDIPAEERKQPMLVIGDRYVAGENAVRSQLRAVFCEAFQIEDRNTLWYYYRPDCEDCQQLAPFLQETMKAYPKANLIAIDTTRAEPKVQFKQRLSEWGVPPEEWQVPFLWNGGEYLSGQEEIADKLEALLAETIR